MGEAHPTFVHPESIEAAITDKSILHEKSFIGGEWVSRSTTFPVYDPATNKIIANIPSLSMEHFTTAIEHAHREFKTFRNTKETVQAKMLHNWAALICQHAQDLSVLLTMENRKTLAEVRGEVEYGATFITWFVEEAVQLYGNIILSQHQGSMNLVIRQPIGVCSIIAPWNFPIAMIMRKIAPAIAAGCTVVVKLPSETPLCTLALTALAVQAGIPPNVIQVVTTRDRNAITELYTHRLVKRVSFTGSTRVGKLITKMAAGTMKKVSMELSGNALYIVFNDADINTAVTSMLACKFRCSGQTYYPVFRSLAIGFRLEILPYRVRDKFHPIG